MSHSKISSTAEPWLLLPLLHMLKKEGTATVYSHLTSRAAIEDLIGNMRGGRSEYNQLIRGFVESVYAATCKEGCIYFLDKTPRYYMIIPEIAELFPEAKFIFLFRNPVQVYASIVSTWGLGALKHLFHHKVDLNEGVQLLSEGYMFLKDRAFAIRYEDFVENPEETYKSLLQYLELEYEEGALHSFSLQQTKGRMGDPTGVKQYKKIAVDGMEKWRLVFNNRFRKRVITNYILSIPEWVLVAQGYERGKILEQIASVKVKWFTPPKDYFHYILSAAAIDLRLYVLLKKEMAWIRNRHIN